jgi:hypothetical protein
MSLRDMEVKSQERPHRVREVRMGGATRGLSDGERLRHWHRYVVRCPLLHLA